MRRIKLKNMLEENQRLNGIPVADTMKETHREIKIQLPEEINLSDFKKQISFISEDIIQYSLGNNELILECKASVDEQVLSRRIAKMIKHFIWADEKKDVYYRNESVSREYSSPNQIMNSDLIFLYEKGIIGLSGSAVKLFDYFDDVFRRFAGEIGAVTEKYPVLLPLSTLKDTGYLKTSPQYNIFCSPVIENMDKLEEVGMGKNYNNYTGEIANALSPSACFHVYERYRNKVLQGEKTVTLLQSVFRNEGRFNWNEFGRLKDYHVREIVFIGNDEYVENSRKRLMKMTSDFMRELDMSGEITSASDAFIIPQMQLYKSLQIKNKVKYEVRLNYSDEKQMAAASFNLHGSTFTYPFNIKVANVDNAVTGCVGYGIERWVLCFLCRFGVDEKNWPGAVVSGMAEER